MDTLKFKVLFKTQVFHFGDCIFIGLYVQVNARLPFIAKLVLGIFTKRNVIFERIFDTGREVCAYFYFKCNKDDCKEIWLSHLMTKLNNWPKQMKVTVLCFEVHMPWCQIVDVAS